MKTQHLDYETPKSTSLRSAEQITHCVLPAFHTNKSVNPSTGFPAPYGSANYSLETASLQVPFFAR